MSEYFFENEFAEFSIENGILIETFKPFVNHVDVSVAKVICEDIKRIMQQFNVMPMLVDTQNAYYMDRSAGKLFAESGNMREHKGVAILMHNPAAFLGAKLYMVVNRPKVKMEVFKDRRKAMDYLQRFK